MSSDEVPIASTAESEDEEMESNASSEEDEDEEADTEDLYRPLPHDAGNDQVLYMQDESALYPSAIPEKSADSLECCLRHLVAWDITPIPSSMKELEEMTRDNVQLMVNRVFQLPIRKTEDFVVVDLTSNKPIFQLPRSMPAPKEKAKTRWDKFAQEKGIFKKKRSRMVWDEVTQDWKPRWGYKSAKHNQEDALGIIEVKQGEDPYKDPFEERAAQKQLVKAKQKMREMRNQVEAAGGRLPAGVANLAADVTNRKTGKMNLDEVMRRAQISTASFGRFDKAAPLEEKMEQKVRRKVAPMSTSSEVARMSKITKKVLKSEDVVDRDQARRIVSVEDEKIRRAERKGGRPKNGGKKKKPFSVKTSGKGVKAKRIGKKGGKR